MLFFLQFQASHVDLDPTGVIYAVVRRGDLGPGHILWYAALKELKVTHAATVQLSVPVLTAAARCSWARP